MLTYLNPRVNRVQVATTPRLVLWIRTAGLPVSEGVLPNRFGGRNSPSAAYAMYAPIRYINDEGLWIGGQFWDSRATGEELGDPLADQALGPFLNPVEMANQNKVQVINDIAKSEYAKLFEQVWKKGSLKNVEAAYDQVALSIAAFERTQQFGQFNSKYDAYLKSCLEQGGAPSDCAIGQGEDAEEAKNVFTSEEWDGLQLFMGDKAKCSACHVAEWTDAAVYALPVQVPDWAPKKMVPPLFTDFTYDNLGVPKSQDPLLVNNPVDYGLGPVVGDEDQNGKFKVMSLRNIDDTAPYAHNGFFESLEEITHFYNTRDDVGAGWPAPEVADTNVNTEELGDLGLDSLRGGGHGCVYADVRTDG